MSFLGSHRILSPFLGWYLLLLVAWCWFTSCSAQYGSNTTNGGANNLIDPRSCFTQWSTRSVDSAVITFITPSTVRPTLINTLDSLLVQTNPNWLVIVIFDGLISNTSSIYLNPDSRLPYYYQDLSSRYLQDGRICILHTMRKRTANCAANTRNAAVKYVSTKWVGFVDDDDTLDRRYVDYLRQQESMHPSAACVIFRMCGPIPTEPHAIVLPPKGATDFFRDEVGISFAVQTHLFQDFGYYFFPSNTEDFIFLNQLRKDGIPIALSPYVAYHIKSFNHSFCQEGTIQSNLIQTGKHNIFLRRSQKWKPKAKREEVWNADIYNCNNRWSQKPPQIFFTEANSIFFADNIRGLNQSLTKAISRGCLGKWNLPALDIHVIFDAQTKPKSPFYIQVQLEQRHSHHFSPRYVDKLNGALQVWEFTHPDVGQASDAIPGVNTSLYYVPTMLMLDQSPSVYSCNPELYNPEVAAQSDSKQHAAWRTAIVKTFPKKFSFLLYRQGVYKECLFDASSKRAIVVNVTQSPCGAAPNHEGYCYQNATIAAAVPFQQDADCEEVLFPTTHSTDALLFGKLQGSYLNGRERVCDGLYEKGHKVACVESVFTTVLNHMVCAAKVVVVNHYFKSSALETHRIDPLLQAGKVVVAVASPHPVVDRYYAPYMPIVSAKELVSTADRILRTYSDWVKGQQYREKVNSFVQNMANNIDPLCLALSQIPTELHSPRNRFSSQIAVLAQKEDLELLRYYEGKKWLERIKTSVRWFCILISLYLLVKFRVLIVNYVRGALKRFGVREW